jgi:hypothetical protein
VANANQLRQMKTQISIFVTFLLAISACTNINNYQIPKVFQNIDLPNGTTKTFTDSLTGECLAIYEKTVLQNRDTFYLKVEFNDRQIFDSTYSKYGKELKAFKLNTEYGLLDGISKTIDHTETEKTYYSLTEVNFADKIASTITTDKSWNYADKNTILEVVNTKFAYLDKMTDKRWTTSSIDSIYYRRRVGLQRMKLFFVESNEVIDFKLANVLVSVSRPRKINCMID